MTDDDLEETLREWARYVRTGRRQEHCGSVEHRYKSPQSEVWERPGPRPPAIVFARAELTERAVTELPKLLQRLLVAHYVAQARPQVTCRRFGVRITDYDAYVQSARGQVRERLTSPEWRAYADGNSTTRYRETERLA